MYVRSLIPQDHIPKKFFDLINELSEANEKVFVNVMQGKDFHFCRVEGERVRTNCWIEISTSQIPQYPLWVPPSDPMPRWS